MSSSSASFRVEGLEGRRLLSGSPSPFSGNSGDSSAVTRQPPVNGGFELAPDFTGWQTAGNDRIAGADFLPPPEGAAQAVLTNGQFPVGTGLPTDAASLATFLGLSSANSLNTRGAKAVNGSAIKQSVVGKAGDIITFKADFLTSEPAKTGNGDYGFVTLTFNGKTQLFHLSDFLKATSPITFAATNFTRETGYHTYAILLPKSGTYTLGFGVVNVGDSTVASDLVVDNVQLRPLFNFRGGDGRDGHGDGRGDKDKNDDNDNTANSAPSVLDTSSN